jgi:acetyl esterase/lipase
VLLDFSERRFRVIAATTPVETTVRLYLCRDQMETLAAVLEPHSLIVLGGRRRWWPTQEERLARKLRRAGHEVVFTEME